MKSRLNTLIALLTLALAAPAVAAPVRLGFDDNVNDPALLQSYAVYRINDDGDGDTPSRSLLGQTPAGTKELTLDLEPGVYTVIIVAVSTQGLQSPDSEPITFLLPVPPVNVRIIIEVAVPTE